MIIGAADAYPSRTNQRLSGSGYRSRPLHDLQLAWFGAHEGIYALHVITYICVQEERGPAVPALGTLD